MFEERFVKHALELARQKGMTQLDFAVAVWPGKTRESANATIIAVKEKNSRGKRQNLRVADAISMARVLGREYPSLCFEVWEKVKLESGATSGAALTPPKASAKTRAPLAVE